MFVPVEPSHELAIGLGQPVISVRAEVAVSIENFIAFMKSYDMVGGGEHHARGLAAGRLVRVIEPTNVGADHSLKRVLDGDSTEVEDRPAFFG